jgi:ribosome-associated protein
MAERFILPEAACEEKFLAATGPGGQNVNKVATAVQLRINVAMLHLPASVVARLRLLAGSKMTADGMLQINARKHRTQDANRTDARARATALIQSAFFRPDVRIATRPSRAVKARRVDAKKTRSDVKAMRGKPALD